MTSPQRFDALRHRSPFALDWRADDLLRPHGGPVAEGKEITTRSGQTLTCARNGDAMVVDRALRYVRAPKDRPAYQFGSDGILSLRTERAATNVALHCRDMTNAAWVKTNVTALKDVVGVDGTVNGASRLTATAGNGTCLQTVTLAESSRMQSVFVRRITGTGAIQMTTDNGSTWTAVTVTATWTRVEIPAQTVTDPVFGFRIVVDGDVIAVDFAQNEVGPVVTSPIATVAAAVTRAASIVSVPFPFSPQQIFDAGGLTILDEGIDQGTRSIADARYWQVGAGASSSTNRILRVQVSGAMAGVALFGNGVDTATNAAHTILPAGARYLRMFQMRVSGALFQVRLRVWTWDGSAWVHVETTDWTTGIAAAPALDAGWSTAQTLHLNAGDAANNSGVCGFRRVIAEIGDTADHTPSRYGYTVP